MCFAKLFFCDPRRRQNNLDLRKFRMKFTMKKVFRFWGMQENKQNWERNPSRHGNLRVGWCLLHLSGGWGSMCEHWRLTNFYFVTATVMSRWNAFHAIIFLEQSREQFAFDVTLTAINGSHRVQNWSLGNVWRSPNLFQNSFHQHNFWSKCSASPKTEPNYSQSNFILFLSLSRPIRSTKFLCHERSRAECVQTNRARTVKTFAVSS